MPVQLGIRTVCGYQREPLGAGPAWPAPVAQTLTQLLPILGAETDDQPLVADVLTPAGLRSHLTGQQVQPRLTLPVRYGGLAWLWCAALGAQARRLGGAALPEALGPGAYRHQFELAPQMGATPWTCADGWVCSDGLSSGQPQLRRGTLVVASDLAATECRSAMVQRLVLSGQASQAMQLALELVAYDLTEAGVNSVEQMQALPVLASPRVLFHDLTWWLGPSSEATALEASNAWAPASVQLSLDHHLAADQRGPEHGTAIAEPWRTQAPTVAGTFTLPRHETLALKAAMRAHATWMLDATWTGPLIGATAVPYSLRLLVPRLTLRQARAPHSAQVGQGAYTWQAEAPVATPAGFPEARYGGPLVVEVVSDQAVNPLLDA